MARSALLNVMVQAAMKAGRNLARDFGEVQNLQVSLKGPGDYVSQADRKAEQIIYTELSRARPDFGFLMEESGEVEAKDGQHRWLIDPLDGTTNFLHGIPVFAVSIALERQGQIVAGVIYNPAMDELYTAERGGGAFLNDRRLRVAARNKLVDTVIGTGIPHLGAVITAIIWLNCAMSWPKRPVCAAWAQPHSTSLMSLPVVWMVSGKMASAHGISAPAF